MPLDSPSLLRSGIISAELRVLPTLRLFLLLLFLARCPLPPLELPTAGAFSTRFPAHNSATSRYQQNCLQSYSPERIQRISPTLKASSGDHQMQQQHGRLNRIAHRIRSKILSKPKMVEAIFVPPIGDEKSNSSPKKANETTIRRRKPRGENVQCRFFRRPFRIRQNQAKSKATTFKQKSKSKEPAVWVKDIHELRKQVLQNRIPLKDIGFNLTRTSPNATTVTSEQLLNHTVIQLIAERIRANSTPGSRDTTDTAHLALAIEGGGMRGAVTAGMAAAIASLGLEDAFDSIYGSSAGAIVGAYMVSRQMCVDVYTEIMPAAGSMFASKTRVMGNVGVEYLNDLAQRLRDQGKNTLAAAVAATNNNNNKSADALVEYIDVGQSLYDLADSNEINNSATTKRKSRRKIASEPQRQRLFKLINRAPLLQKLSQALSSLRSYVTLHPGMNLTFVIDGIMSSSSGLRPFDLDTFRENDAKQPLRVVSSTVRGGIMETAAFGSSEGDYWDLLVEENKEDTTIQKKGRIRRAASAVVRTVKSLVYQVFLVPLRKIKNIGRQLIGREVVNPPNPQRMALEQPSSNKRDNKTGATFRPATACPDNSAKKGLFACLESSMLVPGATGPPLKLLRSKYHSVDNRRDLANHTSICFDAFAYEAIPYRSAVENGATHVLALRSRPDGCFLETKPYSYEKIVAPVYFRRHGLPKVGGFFLKGGSQYRYVEDVMTLDEGLAEGCNGKESKPVKVPPTTILFGTEDDQQIRLEPEAWPEAHLLPVVCKAGTPELPTLTQEKTEVVSAVREGFVAAFDILAPVSGLPFDSRMVDSRRIAEKIFPNREGDDDSNAVDVLTNPIQVKGSIIVEQTQPIDQVEVRKRLRFVQWMTRKREERKVWNKRAARNPFKAAVVDAEKKNPGMVGGKQDNLDWLEAEALLTALPGFRSGKLNHLAGNLRSESAADNTNKREETV